MTALTSARNSGKADRPSLLTAEMPGLAMILPKHPRRSDQPRGADFDITPAGSRSPGPIE